MASDFLYSHPTDNVADVITPTVNLAAATLYPFSRALDKNPATAYKAVAAGAWNAVWDFTTTVNIRWATLVMPNIPAATANVKLEGNSSNSWPGAVSVSFVIPPWSEDGFPFNPYVVNTDLTAYRYWRISVPSFASAFQMSEVALFNTYRTLQFNINWDANEVEKYMTSEHRTSHNVVTEYDRGVSWRELIGEIDATDAGKAAMRSWVRSASGRGKRFWIVPDHTLDVSNNPVINHAWMVKFLNPALQQTLTFLDWTKLTVGWEGLSRGLKP